MTITRECWDWTCRCHVHMEQTPDVCLLGEKEGCICRFWILAHPDCTQSNALYDNMTELINEPSSFSFSGISHPEYPFIEEYWFSGLTVVLQEFLASGAVKRIFVRGEGAWMKCLNFWKCLSLWNKQFMKQLKLQSKNALFFLIIKKNYRKFGK